MLTEVTSTNLRAKVRIALRTQATDEHTWCRSAWLLLQVIVTHEIAHPGGYCETCCKHDNGNRYVGSEIDRRNQYYWSGSVTREHQVI